MNGDITLLGLGRTGFRPDALSGCEEVFSLSNAQLRRFDDFLRSKNRMTHQGIVCIPKTIRGFEMR